MKKNLNVDAMILDLRNVQEDFLDRYEQIKLDCMIALTSPRVQALLSQHNISLDSMLCKNVPEEVSVGVVNGKVTLSSASQTTAGQVLVVNGKLMINPGCRGGFTEVRLHSGQRYDLLPAVPLGSGIRPLHPERKASGLPR